MSSRKNDWDAAANTTTATAVPPPGPPAPPAPSSQVAREMDPSKRMEWRKEAEQKHRQSLRSMAESLSIARETSHTLSMQSEQLGRNERAVEEAQYAVDLSKRIMRGMTWSGWIANAFTAPPVAENEGKREGNTAKNDQQITMGFICPDCKVMFKDSHELATHYSKAHDHTNDHRPSRPSTTGGGGISAPSSSFVKKPLQQDHQKAAAPVDLHDQFLLDLEPQLAELKEASYALGNALDTQNRQLDRLDTKVDRVHDGMKRVSVQAKKLTGTKLPVVFRFRCAFQEVETRKFLRDVAGEAVLGADILVDGCTFRAYTLGDDTELWGFQSETTSLFLGINRLGALKIRGRDLQSYEQFAIETGKPTTTLFAYASYFGYGGWVTRSPSGPSQDDKLTLVRGSPENKATSAAKFKMINLDQIQAELVATK